MGEVERVGQFISFTGEDGLRTIVKISSIQVAAEADPTGSEIVLTTATNRTYRVAAPLASLQEALEADWRLGLFRRHRQDAEA